jgi:hypothetical protein
MKKKSALEVEINKRNYVCPHIHSNKIMHYVTQNDNTLKKAGHERRTQKKQGIKDFSLTDID